MSKTEKGNPEMGIENPSGERLTLLMRLAVRQQRRRAGGRRVSRVFVAGTVLIGGLMGAAVGAYAYFTANGSGTGTAVTVVAKIVSVARGTNNSLSIYPGGVGDIALVVTNPNPYPVTVTEIDSGSTSSIVAYQHGTTTQIPSCTASSGLSFKWSQKTGLAINVAANNGVANIILTGTGSPNSGAIAMGNTSDPTCGTSGGVDFAVPVTVDAASTTGSFSTPVSNTVTVP